MVFKAIAVISVLLAYARALPSNQIPSTNFAEHEIETFNTSSVRQRYCEQQFCSAVNNECCPDYTCQPTPFVGFCQPCWSNGETGCNPVASACCKGLICAVDSSTSTRCCASQGGLCHRTEDCCPGFRCPAGAIIGNCEPVN